MTACESPTSGILWFVSFSFSCVCTIEAGGAPLSEVGSIGFFGHAGSISLDRTIVRKTWLDRPEVY